MSSGMADCPLWDNEGPPRAASWRIPDTGTCVSLFVPRCATSARERGSTPRVGVLALCDDCCTSSLPVRVSSFGFVTQNCKKHRQDKERDQTHARGAGGNVLAVAFVMGISITHLLSL